jgi:hypothetical protein
MFRRFLDAAAGRDDVFNDNELFVRRNLKAAAQDQFARLLFDEDVTFA